MTVGSLFSGIGGFDLGFERAGFEIAWQVEIDPFCRAVLAQHWPDVRRYEDVRETHVADAEKFTEREQADEADAIPTSGHARPIIGSRSHGAGPHQCSGCLTAVDVLCGGFPCQPHSLAGSRGAAADERDLWPQFARLIRELEPRWVVAENVPGLLSSDAGRFFGNILRDLAACGYDAEWNCISAADAGAPHLRERIWIVAYPQSVQLRGESSTRLDGVGYSRERAVPRRPEARPILADTERPERRPEAERRHVAHGHDTGREEAASRARERRDNVADTDRARLSIAGDTRATGDGTSRIFTGTALDRDGWWDVEPNVGRVAHGIPARVDRLRGLGNAIVPHIAEWIGRRIQEAEGLT